MKKRLLMSGVGLVAMTTIAQQGNAMTNMHGKNEYRGSQLPTFSCAASNGNWNFDGLYGPYTTVAVKRFQKAKGLKADGVADRATFKALGLPYTRTLKCGWGGSDVLLVQRRLEAMGYWGPMKPMPMKTPKMMPTPMPTSTPTPEPTPEATPTPEMTPEATPSPVMETVTPPWLELSVGNWGNFVGTPPNFPAGTQPGFSDYLANTTWMGGAKLWFGDVGIGFGGTYFTSALTDFPAGTLIYQPNLMYRFGNWDIGVGYRGYSTLGLGAPEAGIGFDYPLGFDWLRLKAHVDGGYDFISGTANNFVDGMGGIGIGYKPIGLDLGYRYMLYNNIPTANNSNTLSGPTVSVRLAF